MRHLFVARSDSLKDDFDIIIWHLPETHDVTIYLVSDVHKGAKEHMADKWAELTKEVLFDPYRYVILGGDMINNATKSSVSNVYEETMRPRDQKRWLANQLEPMRDRILCVVSGNHERRSSIDVDDDAMYDVMCKLDLEDIYRENAAFIKVRIGPIGSARDGKRHPTYVLAVTHGAGGGAMTGGSVNKNERFAYTIEGADCLIVGHAHKGAVTKPQRLVIPPTKDHVTFQDTVVVGMTSFVQYGGYALQKMLIPASNDIQKVVLSGRGKKITAVW